ncbi:MAG: sigma-70 family RNA polymerase sigma factor [bacterium]|nr:sigma-70 family RNA polymerase sigma factor [bacterium]
MLAATLSQSLPGPSGDLERIFQQHHSRVFSSAYRVTGSAQDAEDCLQTVFLRLLRRQDRLDLSPSPMGYLHRAAVNAALDLMRARSRSRSIPLDELDVPPAEDGQPDQRQQDREIRRGLRQAILQLPAKSATIFTMRFLEGTPNREIADAMGMSQAAVGVAVHRARNQVKKEMASFVGGN